ncbi:MAG TPA: hypothetical protein VGN16_11915 [Acidobacteriaceae bacterium]
MPESGTQHVATAQGCGDREKGIARIGSTVGTQPPVRTIAQQTRERHRWVAGSRANPQAGFEAVGLELAELEAPQ